MRYRKGASLPIRTIIILTLAIIVMLAVIALFSSGWESGKINETQKRVDEKYGNWWESFSEHTIQVELYDSNRITSLGRNFNTK